jgi:hypothetical protein
MAIKDPARRREYERRRRGYKNEWDRTHRPGRTGTHTDRRGYAVSRDHFVMVDGEGFDEGGRHRYAYLAASDGERLESLYNPEGLSNRECWEFLLELPEKFGPSAFVAYSFGYDTEFWIPTRLDRQRLLDERGFCLYGPFRFILWPHKRYTVSRREGRKSHVCVDDIFSYFGCSFEEAIDSEHWALPLTHEESRLLHEGKALRGEFTRANFESGFVQRYNFLELKLGVALVRKLRAARESVGIYTSDYYSPANLAVALFKKYGVKVEPCPPSIERPAYAAYFGGRIETSAFGTYRGRVYEYDINRAYPAAMSVLPNLHKGDWKRSAEYRLESSWSVYRVRWDFPGGWRFYPLPWRDTNGAVCYPPRGTSWVWAPEIQPWMLRHMTFLDGWHFIPSEDNVPPFGWQEDVYRQTVEFEERGEFGAKTALKLAQNSSYGKLAQQTAAQRVRPTFHNPVYSGLITSITRSRLWYLLREFGEPSQETPILAFCTDAIYTTRPLTNPVGLPPESVDIEWPISGEFGSLKLDEFEGIQLLQSGVYRLLHSGKWKVRARGFGSRNVPWDLINEGWRNGAESVAYYPERFIGHRWARHARSLPARQWIGVRKEIRLGAVGKRYLAPAPSYTAADNPAERLYWTKPMEDVEWLAESAANLPNFLRRPIPPPEGTAEDVRDLGWEETPEILRVPSDTQRPRWSRDLPEAHP